jgi:ArsR family transcriptional regulator
MWRTSDSNLSGMRSEPRYLPGMDLNTAARRLAELGNVTRLQIVRLLVQAGPEGLAIGAVQSQLGVPASTLAFHVRGLVSAGLVDQKREGRVVRCRTNIATINDTLAFVKEYCCAGFAGVSRPREMGAVGQPFSEVKQTHHW